MVPETAESPDTVTEEVTETGEVPEEAPEEVVPTEAAELDEVEKLLFPSSDDVGPTTPLPECSGSKFGCCPDGKTPGNFVVVADVVNFIKLFSKVGQKMSKWDSKHSNVH